MLLPLCSGCRQPLDELMADCRYCGSLLSGRYVGRHLPEREVWCTSEQRYITVGRVAAGRAFLCECAKVHEVVECGNCGKAWGTAVNSFGELDRSGLRRCAACRVPTAEQHVAVRRPCTRCGTSTQLPVGRASRALRGLWPRRGQVLECVECRAPVGWWRVRKHSSTPRSIDDSHPTGHAQGSEFAAGTPRWNGHGDDDQFVPGDSSTPGESAAA